MWTLSENSFDPRGQHHHETIFTLGNGYLATRGAFEEGYPGDRRATFIHGVFDDVPLVFTELANAPDWLPFTLWLDGERFSLAFGTLERFERSLDLRTGLLSRRVRWVSPGGRGAEIVFERFASLADPHLMLMRCCVTPYFTGTVEFRAGLHGYSDNEGVAHWDWVAQGSCPPGNIPTRDGPVFLHNRTRHTHIDHVAAMRLEVAQGRCLGRAFWDVQNAPTQTLILAARPGETLVVDKFVAVATSRETAGPLALACEHLHGLPGWPSALEANRRSWEKVWAGCDVEIEGDEEAQLAVRFSLFQLFIAAPHHEDAARNGGVNIGAKTLSGFGYRGHAFWDTEIFMLPVFTYTAPHLARSLLDYRYYRLPAARRKAQAAGCQGAFFAWESAASGEEVTPVWLPDFTDKTRLVRIWTGDLALHISADVAYGAYQYWQASGDDAWFMEHGAELILDTARFWASRAEWNASTGCYEYTNVLGPDEYHDRVNNNAYTNRLAQWNLQTALEVLGWLHRQAPARAAELWARLELSEALLAHWREVAAKIHLHVEPNGLIEQFSGFFGLKPANLADYEPRTRSMQEIFGVEGANDYQALKQPDVLMLQYLLRDHYPEAVIRTNYDYYTPRTDLTYGSSLGPSIQAALACWMGYPDEAYEHFIRTARADLRDVRGNAGDGIHGASAGGAWQAVVFGFCGLRLTSQGWTTTPRLPRHWKRVTFRFYHRGEIQQVQVQREDRG